MLSDILILLPNREREQEKEIEKYNIILCDNNDKIYSYNEYIKNYNDNDNDNNNELFIKRKWSIENCTNEMLEDIIKKNINKINKINNINR